LSKAIARFIGPIFTKWLPYGRYLIVGLGCRIDHLF